MTRRRAPTPLPALRALASIPLAGALLACSPAREEPPLPAGVSATTSANVPVTVPGLIAAGEILVEAVQAPQVPVASAAPPGAEGVRKELITKTLRDRSPARAAATRQHTSSGSKPDELDLSPTWR